MHSYSSSDIPPSQHILGQAGTSATLLMGTQRSQIPLTREWQPRKSHDSQWKGISSSDVTLGRNPWALGLPSLGTPLLETQRTQPEARVLPEEWEQDCPKVPQEQKQLQDLFVGEVCV